MEEQVKRKTALMLRVGGVGDAMLLTTVGKQLNKQGYDVDFFVGSPTGMIHELFKLPYFRTVKQIIRITNIDAVKQEDSEDFIAVACLLKNYDEVFDFKYSIEDNRPSANYNKHEGWRVTINSNYQNWTDISLQWANIDPTKVSDEDKRPELYIDKEDKRYCNWLDEVGIVAKDRRDFNVIGIQLQASTLIRSWYKAAELPKMIHEKYPNDIVLVYTNDGWQAITRHGMNKIKFDSDLDNLVSSAHLISRMNCFISADSGMSHVAEALDVHTITTYTTVPAWTRAKYYQYSHSIESTPPCHPCFVLDVFCPLERIEAAKTMTTREKEIVETLEKNGDMRELCKRFNTVPRAIQGEYESSKKRVESLSAVEPACVKSITAEAILEKLDEILGSSANEFVGQDTLQSRILDGALAKVE